MSWRRHDPVEYQRGYEAGIRGQYNPCGCTMSYAQGWYDGMTERGKR
jgi:ribosome modulation factor